ncbi:MAG TPA: MFS transporter [Syntrophales bacterium]|nr:MFS transporter [Syntrophales bacterium]HPX11027.1 MFS transporter [Syntrophales bacterium]HQB29529.1 MFS transporter [Syntrophales bacterium]HQN78467.1 MFS transporter [Syntrophales bacterium]HQQ27249.1 MFS transporter [Syntrophales bacterium]
MGDPSPPTRLLTFEFLALLVVILAAFCNVSVFYSFYHYLGTLGIPLPWRGVLVGLEPMSAFILRLFVLPWLHVRNAMTVTFVSLVLLIAASVAYLQATTVPALIVLRIFHGAVFVLLTSAVIALVVNFIPGEKSGQGFGILSVATMIPYAVIPPLSEALLPRVRNEADLYAAVSLFSVVAIVLLVALRGRIGGAVQGMDRALLRRPSFAEIRENFRIRAVFVLLASVLLVYLAHATFFYFLKDLFFTTGSGDVGLFFTVSMAAMIAVRAAGAPLFDRMDKLLAVRAALGFLVPCILLMPYAASPAACGILAAVYGICMGVILPLLNALLFSASPPALRALNTNMTLFTMDMAYFLTPYLGGTLIALGGGFDVLFFIAAGIVALALSSSMALARGEGKKL